MPVTDQIISQANQLGIPPDLALSLAQRESGLSQDVIGSAGEIGVFQILPSTATELGINPYNLEENIWGGLTYLKSQFDKFGSWDLALAAYNAGPGNVSRGTIPLSTQNYVSDILGSFKSSLGIPYQFSTTVYSTPLESFPWWVLAVGIGALAFLAAKKI